MTADELIDNLIEYDVIFVGEKHDAAQAHQAELQILTNLAKKTDSLVLALEMFEQDVQKVLTDYLDATISEDSFLAYTRPWGNYATDYKPLVEFAREDNIPVIAANIPRRAASVVARSGEVSNEVLGSDSIWKPDTLHLDSQEYFERFEAIMQAMSHGGPMGQMNIDALYKAQVLKDAAMAASLTQWLDRKILFVCGSFHCDYHLGIPYQLIRNHPALKIAVVTLKSSSEELSAEERSKIADYIWLYTPEEKTD